jgi:hypothetical protein
VASHEGNRVELRPMKTDKRPDLSRISATRCLVALAVVTLSVTWFAHIQMPLVPHSSHDAFLLVPQLQHQLGGAVPDEAHFGMFSPTWFSPHAIPTGSLGWSGFWERVFGNVQSHTWIDVPHPMALMALIAYLTGGGIAVPILVQWSYLLLLLLSLYGIGVRCCSRRTGVLAAVLAAGSPALLGSARFIEPHLAVAAVSTAVVCVLIHTDGFRRTGACLVASFLMWSLSRSGEGSGEAVIAGLLVLGPGVVAIVRSDRSMAPGRWALGLLALVLPFVLLADLPWMVDAMERVTRAFADPVVQTDVAEKGGALAHPVTWFGAYVVLLVTDYLRPLLAVVVVVGLMGLRTARFGHKWTLVLWLLIPWLALSWMQRKASWYGLGLIPPMVLFAAIGLNQFRHRWVVRTGIVIALTQLSVFTVVSADSFAGVASWLREPLAMHAWRMRRVDWLRPMDAEADHQVSADLDRVIAWVRAENRRGPIALMTMGSQHDYAARYHLSMALPGVEVVNLSDPRVRAARYRSLHPSDFSAFVFLDGGVQSWPPSPTQASWLSENLRCVSEDPFDPFMSAVFARARAPQDGFYPLEPDAQSVLGPGQIWSGPVGEEGLCAR